MADEQIVTSIVAKADLSSLVSEVHRATASLQQLQRELNTSNKSIASATKIANNLFRDTLVGSGMYASNFVNLNSDVDKFGKNLDAGRLKLKDYFTTYQTHLRTSKGLIRELAREQVMLQNSVLQPLGRNAQGLMQYNVMIPRGLDEVANKMKIARMEAMIMNKTLSQGATALINWGKNTQWAGRQLTVGLTVPMTMFGSAAAKAFREADQELVRLTKVYGGLAATSAQDLKAIREDVVKTSKELSQAYGSSFKDTIALAADIAATGKTGNDLLSSVKETTRLAILGEVDRQEAMKATLAIQTAFKQNTQELTETINFLNAVENQTSTTLNDLVEAIPKAGPIIKGLGGSVKDLALYLTAMREGGIAAGEGANALKSGLASLINPTKVAQARFKEFGIDILGIVNSNAGNVTATILELQKSLEKLNPLQKQQALEQLFGKFQFARMNALFENLGKQGSQTLQVLDLMKASSQDLANIAGRELTQVTESASGKYRRAIETLRASLATTGEQFLGVATKFINAFSKVLDFFNNLPEPIKKAVTYLGGFTAVIGPIIMLTGVLANFFGYITKGIVQLRAFFQRAHGWKMLTPEIIAAQKAADLVEQSFYSDAKAAEVLHGALTKLTSDYMNLQKAMLTGTIPVNPAVTTVAGRPVMDSLRRVVDPNDPYVGDINTRAMSHINPRDPNNPASIFGGVPGAVPVNRGILRTPQIYMQDRLPNIEGLTSVKGISTGIVSGEAARFHALMATLGMQTEAEVANLKKTIALGGTVSAELLDTFDDILPITTRLADNAATQSARIVTELRAGKMTVDQAKTEIMAINAQLETALKSEVAAYAASRGRTIDFTKAPLMNQPVVDATGQFTLRDLYKKEANRAVMEEFGRLRGVRTFGAPYSIQTTRLPKLNAGGDIESFGPNKTVVSGPTSINYDDRLGTVPVGGYVLNQGASLDPANRDLVAMAPYTFEDGGKITAALTPGEVVFGPKINKIPGLYDAVDAANNGYSFGGQIMRNVYGYGKESVLSVWARLVNSKDYPKVIKAASISSDAAILSKLTGMPIKDAIALSKKDYEDAIKYANKAARINGTDKTIEFVKARTAQLIKISKQYPNGNLILDAYTNKNKYNQANKAKGHAVISTVDYTKDMLSVTKQLEADGVIDSKQAAKVIGILGGLKNFDITDPVHKSHFLTAQTSANIFKPGELEKLLIQNGMSAQEAKIYTNVTGIRANNYAYQSTGLMGSFNTMFAGMARNKNLNFADVVSPFQDEAKSNFISGIRGLKASLGIKGKTTMEDIIKQLTLTRMKSGRSFVPTLLGVLSSRGSSWTRTLSSPAVASFVSKNMGGFIPGGSISRPRNSYGSPMSLLNPSSMLKVLSSAKSMSSKSSLGSFANMPTVNYSHQILPSSGRSYPIPGVSGIYKNDKGELVFFKGVPNEITAKAEMYGTRMAREVFGLDSPNQTIKTILNPFDPSKKSKLLGLESPFDSRFSAGGTKFTEDQMIRQHIAALLMNNKDLSKSNVFGNVLADVGPAGVFSRASMNTSFAESMNSMEKQAMINLLAVRGGARKDFAYNTSGIASEMSSRQYGAKMKAAMKNMHPRLKAFINSLPESDRAPYIAMLARLEEGMKVNWSKYQSIHANPQFNKGGGIIRHGRSAYGRPGNPAARAQWEAKQRLQRERDLAAARSRAASHQIYGQQGLTTGLGREAVRQGTTSFYNPGAYLRSAMIPNITMPANIPFIGNTAAIASIPNMLSKSLQKMAITIKEGANAIAVNSLAGAKYANASFKSASTSLTNGMKSYASDMQSHGRRLAHKIAMAGQPIRQAQAEYMAGQGYIVRSNTATGRPVMENGKQVPLMGPGLVGSWGQGGVVDSQGRMVQDISTRKVGVLGMRRREFLIDDKVLSEKEAKAAGYRYQSSGSMGAQMGVMMGGQLASQAAFAKGNEKMGYGLMAASTLAMFAPIHRIGPALKSIGPALKSGGAAIKTMERSFHGLVNLIAKAGRLVKGFGLIGIAVTIGTIIYKIKKHIDDMHQNTQLAFGMTKKGAQQAGIEYFNLAEKMKLVQERQKAMAASAKGSFQGAGVPGLALSIKDLQKEKEFAKKNLTEFIDTFNSASNEQVLTIAKNLKSQFIAGGMSAEEATKKIYATIAVSDKATQAFQVLADKGFMAISDKAKAAEFTIQNFSNVVNGSLSETGFSDYKTATIEGISAVINTFDEYQKSIIGTKNSMGELITASDAFGAAMEKFSKIPGFNESIGAFTFGNLPAELQAITTQSDSIAGIIAKWKLLSSDVVMNFKEMSSEAAVGLVAFNSAFATAMTNLSKSGGTGTTFEGIGKALSKIKKITDANSIASQRAYAKSQRNAEDEIKLINKKIAAIQKEAQEKLKAIQKIQDAENYQIQVQQAQIEYQDAIARGDMSAAAQAQLKIQQLQREYQLQLAQQAIESEAAKQEEILRKKAEQVTDAQTAASRAAQAASERSADAQQAGQMITGFRDRYQSLLTARNDIQFLEKNKQAAAMEESNQNIAALIKEIQDTGKGKGFIAQLVRDAFKTFFDSKGNPITALLTKTEYLGSTLTTTTTFNPAVGGQISSDIAAANAQADKIVQGIAGGMTLKQLAVAMGLKVPGNNPTPTPVPKNPDLAVTPAPESLPKFKNNNEVKEYIKKNGTTWTDPSTKQKWSLTGGSKTPYQWQNGNSYISAVRKELAIGELVPGILYQMNESNKQEGLLIKLGAGLKGQAYPNISTSPMFNIPENKKYGMNSASSNNYGGVTVINNINAPEGMNIEELSDIVTKKTVKIINDLNNTNAYKRGLGRLI